MNTELNKLERLTQWMDHCIQLLELRQQWHQLSQNSFRNQSELCRVEKELGWKLISLTP